MKKLIITITLIVAIILSSILLISSYQENQANHNDFLDNYTYTKAICDDNNYCQDNVVSCDGKNVVSITPITGAAVQMDDDWKDPREDEEINKLC